MICDENPLDTIWKIYRTTTDCIKVALRTTNREIHHLLHRTGFIDLTKTEAETLIQSSHKEADDFVILSLWVEFERFLVDYIRKKGEKLNLATPKIFAESLYNRFDKEVEYWKTDDILDMFKGVVAPDLIGNAKKVKDYRDWIAHKNIRKGSPDKAYPDVTFRTLSAIIKQIHDAEISELKS